MNTVMNDNEVAHQSNVDTLVEHVNAYFNSNQKR